MHQIERIYQYDTPEGTETVTIESVDAVSHSCAIMEFERLHNCTLSEVRTSVELETAENRQ